MSKTASLSCSLQIFPRVAYPRTHLKAHLVSKTDGGILHGKFEKNKVVRRASIVILETCLPQLK